MVNASLPNVSLPPIPSIGTGQGEILLILLAIALIILFYIFIRVVKDLIANAIAGGIGLIVMHFLFPSVLNIAIPLSLRNIIISLIGGIAGLAIVLVLTFFGIN